MPMPWPDTGPCLIEDQAHRGITIYQMRVLRTFLQRLCKADLLRSKDGSCIDWFGVNMYDISSLVIKQLISHVEDNVRRTRRRYSWVEFVANGPQPARIHMVHAWNGRFRDFLAVVDALARDRGLASNDALWICIFANSQFGEDFGPNLRSSPFQKSIMQVQWGAVLIIDRDGTSLSRIWCGLELYLVQESQKELMIYTPVGKVGKDVKTGSLVEALQLYDITLCEASQESDRRQILNFLGGGEEHELDGLQQHPDGAPVLEEGWRKRLDSQVRSSKARKRQNGTEEYAHEAELIEKHHEVYKALNNQIRNYVKTSIDNSFTKPTNKIREMAPQDRGITLGEWKTFGKLVRNWAIQEGKSFEALTIDDVAKDYVTGITSPGVAYCELLNCYDADHKLRPQFMIDEPKKGSFADLLSSLEWFAEAVRLTDDTVLWCQLVCVRQHDVASEFNGWLDKTLPALLKDCDGLFSFLPNNKSLIVRCNRMFAWQLCFENAKDLYLGCTTGVLSCNTGFAEGGHVFGLFDLNIARIIIEADWKLANSADPKLGPMVAKRIQNSSGSFEAYTGRLCRMAAGPLMRHAARTGGRESVSNIQQLCRYESVMLNSSSLSGCLRETAVHIAAANGHVDVLKALLDLQADPNSEDHLRETPLHYAALTGKASSVKILLRYGARPRAENAFAETPLNIATANLAEFIGVDTKRVVALLRSWEAIDDNMLHAEPWMGPASGDDSTPANSTPSGREIMGPVLARRPGRGVSWRSRMPQTPVTPAPGGDTTTLPPMYEADIKKEPAGAGKTCGGCSLM